MAALLNKPECIAVLATAKASLEGAMAMSPIGQAASQGADDAVRLLAHLGARLIDNAAPDWHGGPFWRYFKDKIGRVRDLTLWERIVRKGGDEGTPESLRKRIRMLKKSGVHDPRDGTSWYIRLARLSLKRKAAAEAGEDNDHDFRALKYPDRLRMVQKFVNWCQLICKQMCVTDN